MGSIFSAPKIPAPPPIIYETTPDPTPAPVDTTTTSTTDPNAPPDSSTDDSTTLTPDQLRVQDILTRKKGPTGTIGTSFRGVLTTNDQTPQRKTLLGE